MRPSEPVLARLDAEIAAWQALLELLRDEEAALVAGDAERVARLTPAKLAQVQEIGAHVRTRQDALAAAGHPADSAGMAAWLGEHAQPEFNTRWQRLGDLEAAARAANQRVGVLVEMRLGAARQALNVLVHATSRGGGLYDQSGFSVAARPGKPLSAA